MLSYDEANHELRFVTDHFAANETELVIQVRWKQGIKAGKPIQPGTVLATVYWSDGTEETMRCPTGCRGVIDATNRRIDYLNLPFPPSQVAVRVRG